MASEATERIIEVLRALPEGVVVSYGQVAAMSGLPRGARQVVRILSSMSRSRGLPWWRVLRKDGSIALGEGDGAELQRSLLESEGVEVSPAGKVDMARYGVMGPAGE